MKEKWAIIGLGNPGSEYKDTRHNAGFMVADLLSNRLGFSFKRERWVAGVVAKGDYKEKEVFLLKPTTYMNLSGKSVKELIHLFKIPLAHVIIVHDEAMLPLGTVRVKTQGSSGGHNGLKSIQHELQTTHYLRLRVGIAPKTEDGCAVYLEDLATFALSPFEREEKVQLVKVIDQAADVVLRLLEEPVSRVMEVANRKTNVVGDGSSPAGSNLRKEKDEAEPIKPL